MCLRDKTWHQFQVAIARKLNVNCHLRPVLLKSIENVHLIYILKVYTS